MKVPRPDTKTCGKCGMTKLTTDFFKGSNVALQWWCKLCQKEYQKSVQFKSISRDSVIRRKYGITSAEYDKILEAQGGGCAGCGRQASGHRNLDIDHRHQPREKHRTGAERRTMVRGLLCWKCNRSLGLVRDSPGVLINLARYLESPPAKKILS